MKPETIALMIRALQLALVEIHNPGANDSRNFDITGHIEQVIKLAEQESGK